MSVVFDAADKSIKDEKKPTKKPQQQQQKSEQQPSNESGGIFDAITSFFGGNKPSK